MTVHGYSATGRGASITVHLTAGQAAAEMMSLKGHSRAASIGAWAALEKQLGMRLRITWKVQVVAFLALGLVCFFGLMFLVLQASLDPSVAAQRALRASAEMAPLPARRHRFEVALASAILKQPMVLHAVDELLKRVAGLGEAVASRPSTNGAMDGLSHDTAMQFLFGTSDRRIAGAVGWDVSDLRRIVYTDLAPLRPDHAARVAASVQATKEAARLAQDLEDGLDPEERPELDLSKVNLREKMTLLYIATMQPASRRKERLLVGRDAITEKERDSFAVPNGGDDDDFDATTTDGVSSSAAIFPLSLLFRREVTRYNRDRAGYEAWAEENGLQLDLASLFKRAVHEHEEGSLKRTQLWRDTRTREIFRRKCFLPFFVPLQGPVRECQCIDSDHEERLGCRRLRGEPTVEPVIDGDPGYSTSASWEPPPPPPLWTKPRTAASTNHPHPSRRELAFALRHDASTVEAARWRKKTDVELLRSSAWLSEPLPWVSGASVFAEPPAETSSEAAAALRALHHNRFVAGPSSTTDAMLQLARFFGLTTHSTTPTSTSLLPPDDNWLYLMRLALIAYLVPAHDHSVLEVLVASTSFHLQPSLADLGGDTEHLRGAADTFARLIPNAMCLPHMQFADSPEVAGSSFVSVQQVQTSEGVLAVLEGLGRGFTPTATQHRSHDVMALSACMGVQGTMLTRGELNDAMSLAILEEFTPAHLKQLAEEDRLNRAQEARKPAVEVIQAAPDAHSDVASDDQTPTRPRPSPEQAGLCSDELAFYWRLLDLGAAHAQHSSSSSAESEPPCNPNFALIWLTRAIYHY